MCSPEVTNWFSTAVGLNELRGKEVLEVGSYDVNGSVRPDVMRASPASYTGVDMNPGPSVDKVVHCESLVEEFGLNSFDVVISTELLEHVRDWSICFWNMVTVLRPGGLLVVTTRSPGFPYHPYPEDHWRYTQEDIRRICDLYMLTDIWVEDDPVQPGVFFRARKLGVDRYVSKLDAAWIQDIVPVERVNNGYGSTC